MDFSNLRVNPNRLPKIFASNSQCIADKESKRIDDLLLKEGVKGELTPKEYDRLEKLQEKQKYSSPHTVGIGGQAYLLFIYSLKKYGNPAKIITDHIGEPSASNGILKENYVINLLQEHRGITIYRNKARIKNDYLMGVPDAFDDEDWKLSKFVHEIKTTSNRVKFLNKKLYPVTVHNFLQAQGYMALTGKKKAVIHHCLVDYSEIIISDQRNRLFDYFCPDGYETARFSEAWVELEGRLRFSDMKPEARIFSCYFDRDDRVINKIYKKVQVCRNWLNDYAKFNEEIESSGISTILKNSYSVLHQRLGLE